MSNPSQPKKLTVANAKSSLASHERSHALNSTTKTASIRVEHRHIRDVEGVATPGPDVGVAAAGAAREGKGMSRVPLASRRIHDHRSRLLAFTNRCF